MDVRMSKNTSPVLGSNNKTSVAVCFILRSLSSRTGLDQYPPVSQHYRGFKIHLKRYIIVLVHWTPLKLTGSRKIDC